VWRQESEFSPPHLRRILAALEDRAGAAAPGRGRERVIEAIMLLTSAMADRARQVGQGAPVELGDAEFLGNLADVIVAGLEAAVGAPLH
jgi:hypothetical protein